MSNDDPFPPELDGTGGGYGKYKGSTVREISGRFNALTEEPNMRSVRAVLRITREQLEARGSMAQYRWMAIIAVAFTAIAVVGIVIAPSAVRILAEKAAIAGLVVTTIFTVGAASAHGPTTRALAQERAIRQLALDALVQIVSTPGFVPGDLNSDLQRTLREVLRRTKRSEPALQPLLD